MTRYHYQKPSTPAWLDAALVLLAFIIIAAGAAFAVWLAFAVR